MGRVVLSQQTVDIQVTVRRLSTLPIATWGASSMTSLRRWYEILTPSSSSAVNTDARPRGKPSETSLGGCGTNHGGKVTSYRGVLAGVAVVQSATTVGKRGAWAASGCTPALRQVERQSTWKGTRSTFSRSPGKTCAVAHHPGSKQARTSNDSKVSSVGRAIGLTCNPTFSVDFCLRHLVCKKPDPRRGRLQQVLPSAIRCARTIGMVPGLQAEHDN